MLRATKDRKLWGAEIAYNQKGYDTQKKAEVRKRTKVIDLKKS